MHENNKSASNNYTYVWEENANSSNDEVKYVFTLTNHSYNSNMIFFCFEQTLKRKRKLGQIELD
jgi:hypothetical protein